MRKRFSDGKVNLPYKQFLGYRKGADGLPEIVPEEAETVKEIYRMCYEGKAPSFIARHLTATGIPTPGGKSNWRPNTVESILTNEKYKGDALLQKKFTVDFLSKRTKVNEGEVPQYYVEGSHPAIVAPELFDAVQAELKGDQVEYQRQYDDYETRFTETHQRINRISEQREALTAKRGRMQNHLETLTDQELITEFDEALWYGTVDQIRVTPDGKLRFSFKDGTEIEE